MILSIIPARGGSKGIPRKNLKSILKVPLLVYSIQHALESKKVDRVVVSTDDDEIAALATGAGAEVVFRPSELSGDSAPSEGALLHVLDTFKTRGEKEPDLVVFLQATSPIRRPEHIDEAVMLLQEGDFDSVFSASPAHGFIWGIRDGECRPLNYDPASRPMRQQFGEYVMENGSIYVFKPWILREIGVRIGGKIGIYRMGFLESLQIDQPKDLVLARTILRCLATHPKKTGLTIDQ